VNCEYHFLNPLVRLNERIEPRFTGYEADALTTCSCAGFDAKPIMGNILIYKSDAENGYLKAGCIAFQCRL